MQRTLPFFFVFSIFCALLAKGGAQDGEMAEAATENWSGFRQLDTAIAGLKTLSPTVKNYVREGKNFSDLWREMKRINDGLATLAKIQQPTDSEDDHVVYNKTLVDLAEALLRVANDNKQTVEAKFNVCSAVLRDLELKQKVAASAQSASAESGADSGSKKEPPKPSPVTKGGTPPSKPIEPNSKGRHEPALIGEVEVSVATSAGGQMVGGCEVWCVLEAWADVEDRFERFPTLSSPANRTFAPGYYKMWTVRAGHRGPTNPVTVTGEPRSRLVVELTAPD